MNELKELVDKQLNAYNEKDLDTFCSCYHNNISICVDGDEKMVGISRFKDHYSKMFSGSPNLFAEIKERMVLQNHVIDIEEISGKAGSNAVQKITAKYSFDEGLISKVEFFVPVEEN